MTLLPLNDLLAAPVVLGGLAFCVSRTLGLNAIHLDSGNLAWTIATLEGWGQCKLWGDRLLVVPRPSTLAIVDAASGTIQDAQTVEGITLDYSVLHGNDVICPTEPDSIGCWDLVAKQWRWRVKSGWSLTQIAASAGLVCVAEPRVYVGIDALSGEERWRFDVTEHARHTRIIGGAQPGETSGYALVSGDAVYAGASGGWIFALDAATGSLRWSAQAGPLPQRQFALSGARLVALSLDSLLIVDQEIVVRRIQGQQRINGDGPFAPPAVDKDLLWSVDVEGDIIAVSLTSSSIVTRIRTGTRISRAPVVAGDRLVLVDDMGRLLIYGITEAAKPS